jgi:6-pyruvoyltetrahydropterin/6-carboxytetrahydropterin synthase
VEGEVDPETGYVMDLNLLKDLAQERLLQFLDHKNLNLDVPWFRELIPTSENIAVVCWRELRAALPETLSLRLRLWETPRNYVDYQGA